MLKTEFIYNDEYFLKLLQEDEEPYPFVKPIEILSLPPIESIPFKEIFIYGQANPNPGPGSYGIYIKDKDRRKDQKLSEVINKTTCNRIVLLACIRGLREIKEKSNVNIYTTSKYLKMLSSIVCKNPQSIENYDLYKQLHDEFKKHNVRIRHCNNIRVSRAKSLATKAKNKNKKFNNKKNKIKESISDKSYEKKHLIELKKKYPQYFIK